MRTLFQVLTQHYPAIRLAPEPDRNAEIYDDGTGAKIVFWNHDELGEQPTAEQLAAWMVESEPTVPVSVTPLQMRRALNASGLRPAVEAAVAGADQNTRDAWEFASEVLRTDPLLNAMAQQMGMTSDQVDQLFNLAALS